MQDAQVKKSLYRYRIIAIKGSENIGPDFLSHLQGRLAQSRSSHSIFQIVNSFTENLSFYE